MLSSTVFAMNDAPKAPSRLQARETAPFRIVQRQSLRFLLCALRHLREHAAVDFFPDVRLKGHVMFQELVNFIEIVSVRAVKFL